MPRRTDIRTILIIGSGPIVIGQGCEFDYSGTQACKALRSEGFRVVLVNSNPATIMTDPEFSDRTYIEPITPESVRKVILKQIEIGDPIDAVLPTLGGQTALNCACALWDDGTFQKYNVKMIGADRAAIHRAEDRQAFKELCEGLGLRMAKATTVTSLEAGREFLKQIGLPAIIRPAFTLGGSGGGIAYNTEEFDEIMTRGLRMSMIGQVQIDQSLLGWKEYELEVIRDKKDNCIVVCGIENIDPMGVHTGDSITIAPILTLTDKEYQAMRDASFAIMRKVGVETGGSNVQFAVNPNPKPGPDGKKPFEMIVVEMNPRVSRSSALASKATGFPIAKIAAKLAVGYTLDELRNDITGTTSACFEPSIDYIVTKMPRWTFEKFPEADETLTTQMKSVGEAMAIGRTFAESFQKAIRSMEVKRFGLGLDKNDKWLAAMRAVEKQDLVVDVMGSGIPTFRVGMGSPALSSPSLREGRIASGIPPAPTPQSPLDAVDPHTPLSERGATQGLSERGATHTTPPSPHDAIDADPSIALHPLDFIPKDPYPPGVEGAVADLIKSRRNLPHFQLPGATYFVSWRSQDEFELSESERQTTMDALRHFDGKRCRVYAACVMSNHVHWIVRPFEGFHLLELQESVKRFSSTQINKARGRTGRVWEPEGFDHIVRSNAQFAEYVAYVVRNPKEAGIVKRAGAYPFTFVHDDVFGGWVPPLSERPWVPPLSEKGVSDAQTYTPLSERGATHAPLSERGATHTPLSERGGTHTQTHSESGAKHTADGDAIEWPIETEKLSRKLAVPSQGRIYYIRYAFKMGWSIKRINGLTNIDPFFLDQIKRLVEFEDVLCSFATLDAVPREVMFRAKQLGYSDAQLANLYLGDINTDTILRVRAHRKGMGIEPVYKLVDTCAAEFEAVTPYYYSTYESGDGSSVTSGPGVSPGQGNPDAKTGRDARSTVQSVADDEIRVTDKQKVIILGGGPNRIGQGIEFDYCCVHAAFAAKELGFEAVMINSNPETVSTDYDTSDLLFFEPLTLEDVLNVVERLDRRPSAVEGDIENRTGQSIKTEEFSSIREQLSATGVKNASLRAVLHLNPNGFRWIAETADGRLLQVDPARREPPKDVTEFRNMLLKEHPNESGLSQGLVLGLIVQFGGQTPLNLAHGLQQAGAPIIGTSVDSIDLAEDRDRFDALLTRLQLQKPPSGIARTLDKAVEIANRIGYPVLVRPSYVLGGRGMEICPDEKALRHYMSTAVNISELDNAPVLIDKFLDDATEVDVDVVADYRVGEPGERKTGETPVPLAAPQKTGGTPVPLVQQTKTGGDRRATHADGAPAPQLEKTGGTPVPLSDPPPPIALICGVMEHIEQAGIHSGDSACTIPGWSLSPRTIERIKHIGRSLAKELRVCGLMNVQMAIKQDPSDDDSKDQIYILEVNPRASRTAPFVGKATHVQWPRIAAKVMMGKSLAELGAKEVGLVDTAGGSANTTGRTNTPAYYAVKESVFPFSKFPGVDVVLGPEMRSTGEVMGIDASLPIAFAKSQIAAGINLPTKGSVFISVREADKARLVEPVKLLQDMGFGVYATSGTAEYLSSHGIETVVLQKIGAGARPNVIDMMADGKIHLVINTPTKTGWQTDEGRIRAATVRLGVPMISTMTGALAAAKAIEALRKGDWGVKAMQDYRVEFERSLAE